MNDQATKTPRTDSAIFMMDGIEPLVPADFARTLERELAAAKEQLAECQAHLAGVAAEATRYEGELAAIKELHEYEVGYRAGMDEYKEQLAAAQAREQGLREALIIADKFCRTFSADECPDTVAIPIHDALSTPTDTDTTALDAVRAEERERCCKAVDSAGGDNAEYHCEAIRAMGDK